MTIFNRLMQSVRFILITIFCIAATLCVLRCSKEKLTAQNEVAQADQRLADSVAKANAARKQKLAQQNNPLTSANEFTYFTADSTEHRLYEIITDYTLLFFYNPECPACKQYAFTLMNSPVINVKLDSRELTVLAMYIDADLKLWRSSLQDYPRNWILAHDDHEYIYKNDIYDVHAIPSLYLLDRNKTVLLKDCLDITVIEQYLLNLD